MSYFIEIENNQTYANSEADFHFSYNANSGGGQSFLGGKFRNEKGVLTPPSILDSYKALFEYIYIDAEGKEKSVLLKDSKGEYEIKPRGEGSTSMKLGIGTKMKTPSKLIATFFMLPPTCVVKSPNELRNSILTTNNYWLQSMWLKCKNTNESEVHLIPLDFVFCGGKSKDNKGNERYFKLEDNKRVNDIIKIAEESNMLPNDISQRIRIFADVYLGNKPFDYETCSDSIVQIMQILAETYPDKYSGIEDPLSFINQFLYEKKRVRDTSFIYTTYRSFITAIKTKPFLLLAGISGTGKSRIVRELARACWDEDSIEYKAQKPKNFEMVQVKPNWHDSTELIGYISRVSGEPIFVAGDFLKFIVKAWENIDVPYFLCLDEMNLAPVEQYFAEFLSVIESRKRNDDGNVITDPIIKPEFEINKDSETKQIKSWYSKLIKELLAECPLEKVFALTKEFEEYGISIPQNLIVIGTVNMDETTFSFSRKVLDRAMTIEMNEVDLYAGLDRNYECIGKLKSDMLIGTAVEGVDVYADNEEVCNKVLSYLQAVNDVLNGTPFKIAYRTRNEFLLYVVNNLPYNLDEKGNEFSEDEVIAIALDEITSMKILSRIEGDDTKIKHSLLEGLITTIEAQLLILTGEEKKIESISVAKLKEMKERLTLSGYTSFWS